MTSNESAEEVTAPTAGSPNDVPVERTANNGTPGAGAVVASEAASIVEPTTRGTSLQYLRGRPLLKYTLLYGLGLAALSAAFAGVGGVLIPNHIQELAFQTWFTGGDAGVNLQQLNDLKVAVEAGTATASPDQTRLLGLLAQFDATRATAAGAISAISVILVALAQPIVGVLSDRTRSRFGRRAPWMLFGATVGAAGMAFAPFAPTLAVLGILWVTVSVLLNVAQGPLYTTLADRIPETKQGRASSAGGTGSFVGGIAGSILAAVLFPILGLNVYYVFSVIVVVFFVLFVVLLRDRSSKDLEVPRSNWRSMLAGFVTPLRFRDFRWVWFSRALLMFGYTVSSALGFFMLQSYIHPALSQEEATALIPVLSISSLPATLLAVFFAGRLSDRVGRRKPFVLASAIIMAVAMAVPMFSPTLPALFIQTILTGLAFGIFLPVDQALFVAVLPDKLNSAGRDWGLRLWRPTWVRRSDRSSPPRSSRSPAPISWCGRSRLCSSPPPASPSCPSRAPVNTTHHVRGGSPALMSLTKRKGRIHVATELAVDVEELTTREQASLTTGAGFWRTVAINDVPSVMMTDGPHGLRKQYEGDNDNLGIAGSAPATCFPPAVGLGQTWDVEIAERAGAALAVEAQSAEVNIVLGPGINIKRDPRCGRNFEYLSEDPIHTGRLATAQVRGMQLGGVGASLKHFALNNQEHDRMRVSSDVDERTMHEIYLRGFEQVVRDAEPWTVMCSYNRINGVHASQNRWLLTEVLRDQWGFAGAVVSDWGAVVSKVRAIDAGLDLQMPGPDSAAEDELVAAVENGTLDATVLEAAASRIASLARLATANARPETVVDVDAHHQLAREIAGAAIVLLKNDGDLLPLESTGTIAVIGEFAQRPRYQAGGSSHVNPTRLDVPLDEIIAAAGSANVQYAPGFDTGHPDNENLRADAVGLAGAADKAVLFLGLSDVQESEGYDRDDIELPQDQLTLLEAVLEVQPNTVVVLSHGGVVRLATGVTEAPAILDGALLGQAGGGAIADVLFGKVNPSGRIAETIPNRIEDVPAWLSFPGERGGVRYAEGVFVGYRWYDARDLDVTFPFGHGLSYTTFAYSDLVVTSDEHGIRIEVTVTNTGAREGREIVQVYTGLSDSAVARPRRELKAFAPVKLEAGERKVVELAIARRELANWDVRVHEWKVESGRYDVHVGASSRDIRTTAAVDVAGDEVFVPLTLESSFTEVMADPIAGPVLIEKMGRGTATADDVSEMGMDVARMAASIPIGRYLGQGTMGLTKADVEAILADANRR